MTQVLRGGILCLLLGVLVQSQVEEEGTGGGCVWDTDTDPNQRLDPSSYDAGAKRLTLLSPEITTSEGCQEACCGEEDCHLAILGTPADGESECMIVSCVKDGRDVCALKPDSVGQFKVYRKTTELERTKSSGSVTNSTALCHQPAIVGDCRAAFPRFYYDITDGSCQRFLYGGCGANENNFETREECETACAGVTGTIVLSKDSETEPSPNEPTAPEPTPDEATPPGPTPDEATAGSDADPEPGSPPPAPDADPVADPDHSTHSRSTSILSRMPLGNQETNSLTDEELALPVEEVSSDFAEQCLPLPDAGPCRASMRHFYYDVDTSTCLPFTYGGCRGNKNNYLSEELCLSSCTGKVSPSSKKAPGGKDYEEACMVRSDPGPCRAAFSMFHFDPASGSCHTFIYGGCRGNKNRYGSEEECMARCTGDQGRVDPHGSRSRWTPAFFLLATLAAISVLLLASLILISTRRAQRQRAASFSDKVGLLPEESTSMEQLSEEQSPKQVRA